MYRVSAERKLRSCSRKAASLPAPDHGAIDLQTQRAAELRFLMDIPSSTPSLCSDPSGLKAKMTGT